MWSGDPLPLGPCGPVTPSLWVHVFQRGRALRGRGPQQQEEEEEEEEEVYRWSFSPRPQLCVQWYKPCLTPPPGAQDTVPHTRTHTRALTHARTHAHTHTCLPVHTVGLMCLCMSNIQVILLYGYNSHPISATGRSANGVLGLQCGRYVITMER